MASSLTQLDSRIRIVSPENIAFEYRIAGPFTRLPAYGIDLIIRIAAFFGCILLSITVYAGLGTVFEPLAGIAGFMAFAFWFALQWFYGGLFEALWNGQTPGKRATNLRVLRIDGRPITPTQAILRNLLKLVDGFPPLEFGVPSYLAGLIVTSVTKRRQRIGDLACGVMVVVEDQTRLLKSIVEPNRATLKLLEQIPVSFQPSRTLAKTVSHYVSRRDTIGVERRREIAQPVADLLIEHWGLAKSTDADALMLALYERAYGDNQRAIFTDDTPVKTAGEPRANREQLPATPSKQDSLYAEAK